MSSAALEHPVLVGLSPNDAERPAADVLGAVPWDGPPLDPDVATASEFLSLL